jgi:hypothetical protein
MTHKDHMSADRLRELLDYNPETGVFTWRVQRRKYPAGMVAGTRNRDGYTVIRTGGQMYFAHKIAWLFVYGSWPVHSLDHINGQPSDNRIANLRLATVAENQWNAKTRVDNSSGIKGVRLRSDGRWEARIRVGGKQKHLGSFTSKNEASGAYAAAALALRGEFARLG